MSEDISDRRRTIGFGGADVAGLRAPAPMIERAFGPAMAEDFTAATCSLSQESARLRDGVGRFELNEARRTARAA